MRKSLAVLGAVLLSALVASAADYEKYEAFLGYSLVGFHPNLDSIPKANFNGGNGQFVYNFNSWIGGVIDGGAVHKGLIGGYSVDTTVANWVAGPRVKMSHGRFLPYVQILFGGAYATTSAQVNLLPADGTVLPPSVILPPNEPVTARIHASDTAFAMLVGGGVDIKLARHVAVRPVEFDYYLTRFSNPQLGSTNQNNWRYSAGVNFFIGGKH